MLKLYDMYEDRNGKIVVSEYCNLGSLKREIKSRKSEFCNQMIAVAILKQVVNGLRVTKLSDRAFTGAASICIRISRQKRS